MCSGLVVGALGAVWPRKRLGVDRRLTTADILCGCYTGLGASYSSSKRRQDAGLVWLKKKKKKEIAAFFVEQV